MKHVQKQAHRTIQIYSEGKCVDFETFDWDLRKKFGSYLYFAFVHPFYTIIHFSRSFSALKHCKKNLMNYANIYPIVSKVDDLRLYIKHKKSRLCNTLLSNSNMVKMCAFEIWKWIQSDWVYCFFLHWCLTTYRDWNAKFTFFFRKT